MAEISYALITGASSGIGAATARCFSQAGYGVILTGRNEERLHAVAKELPSPSRILPADLSRESEAQALIQTIEQDQVLKKNLRVLVNCAGIFSRAALQDLTMADFETQMRVNFLAPVQLMKGLQALLAANAPSSVVNVSSTLGLRPVPNTSHYAAAKSALTLFTQCAALEWAPFKIRVNAVAPGLIETPIHGLDKLDSNKRQALKGKMDTMQPLGRMGTAEEVAEAILFLAGNLSLWTTGVVFPVDGGISLI